MANYGYLIRSSPFSLDEVENICRREIESLGLDGLVEVLREDDFIEVAREGYGYIGIFVKAGTGHRGTAVLALDQSHRGEWMWWLDARITNVLGSELGCRISGDAHAKVWDPDPDRYPDFHAWEKARQEELEKLRKNRK